MLIFAVLVFGLLLLVAGAQVMIQGATALVTAFSVPPVVIGLTIVAFGTSTPELVVNCTAALSHQTELAFGNFGPVSDLFIIRKGFQLAVTAHVKMPA